MDDFDDSSDDFDNSGAPTSDDISSLTSNAATITGTSNYAVDTGAYGASGDVINSSANPITSNSGPVDASGGNGSIPSALQNIATQGLNDAIVSAQDFGIGSLTDLFRGSASGQTTLASAPSPTSGNPVATSFPIGWVVVGALVVFLLVHAAKHG